MKLDRGISGAMAVVVLAGCLVPEFHTEDFISLEKNMRFQEIGEEVDLKARSEMKKESDRVLALGMNNTFKEGGGFSRKDFKEIEKGVVRISLIFSDETNPVVSDFSCTGWPIKTEDPDSLIFALAGHCFKSPGRLTWVDFCRLSVDPFIFSATESEFKYAIDPYNDQALIKIPRPKNLPADFNELDWEEGATIENGTFLLQAGYPGEFIFDNVLFAPVVTVMGPKGDRSRLDFWTLESDLGSYPGSSGAPMAMKDKNGRLKIVAIQTDSVSVQDKKTGEIFKRAIIRSLIFSPLLAQLGY